MARIEWVRQRLENWALWHERRHSAGLGYASSSVFLAERVDQSRDVWVPVDEIEASETDQAVEALKLGYGHLHRTLQLIYLRGVGIKAAALTMRRAESTIHAQLARADLLLALWFADRKRQREAAARELQAKLDAARPAKLQRVA